jgi:SnoaL-like polyketide cyclase
MENEKIVESFFNAIEKSDFTTAESLVSNNFKVTGVGPEALGAKEFLGVHRAFNKGMPDFRFNYKIGSVSKNIVETKVKLTGTHFKEMPSPAPGFPNIPATNKTLRMPEEKVRFTFKDNKIESLHLESVPGGGLPGVLKQLGVEMPKEVHH